MPQHKSCDKRLRQDKQRAARNNFVRQTLKTLAKKIHAPQATTEEKEALLTDIYSKLDKAAKTGVIHKRTASRRKARIAAFLKKEKEKQAA